MEGNSWDLEEGSACSHDDGDDAVSHPSDYDSEDGEDEDEEDEDEEDSESDEDVGIGRDLPRRATRSGRYQALVSEYKDAEDDFWKHETWNEENDDADYICSEGEEMYKDTVDSDFDNVEAYESSESEAFDDDETKKPKKSVYVDPSKLKKNNRKKLQLQAAQRRKKKPASIFENADRILRAKEEKILKKSERSTRATTRVKTAEMQNVERQRAEKKKRLVERREKINLRRKKLGKPLEFREPTQEEHLREARKTEELNKQSLITMQAIQEEKRRYVEYKNLRYKGHYEIYLCWASDRMIVQDAESAEFDESVKRQAKSLDDLENDDSTEETPVMSEIAAKYYRTGDDLHAAELITFTDGKIPSMYQNEPLPAPRIPRCAVTGNAARYFDPALGLFYDSVESFSILRQRYYDEQDKAILSQFQEVENLIREKLTEQCSVVFTQE